MPKKKPSPPSPRPTITLGPLSGLKPGTITHGPLPDGSFAVIEPTRFIFPGRAPKHVPHEKLVKLFQQARAAGCRNETQDIAFVEEALKHPIISKEADDARRAAGPRRAGGRYPKNR
jgi:hypothetical protein